jgi:light-regulated signal transduction histidine kinase (bacteriophytochrome)
VLDSTGQPYAVCGISTDITDRKRAEEQVRQLNAGLETRVAERTAELEASTRELDAFSYSVSHDLRAPLRSLHGFSQAILDDYGELLDDTGRGYLDRLQINVKRMGQMIDDLLNLSRATRADFARESVDLSGLAREIMADLSAADPDRTVKSVVADNLTALGDRALLRMVLQNLLSNAWKYTAKVPVATIEVGRTDRNGGRTFFVRDDGAGFDTQYADKLFVAFQRLHPTAEFEGNGIGLAIVQRIVRRHGGQVSAESELGHGATFYFTVAAVTEVTT